MFGIYDYVSQYFYPVTAETDPVTPELSSPDISTPELAPVSESVAMEVTIGKSEDSVVIDQVSEIPTTPMLLSPIRLSSTEVSIVNEPTMVNRKRLYEELTVNDSSFEDTPSRFTQAMLGSLPMEIEDDGEGYQMGPQLEIALPVKQVSSVQPSSQVQVKKWRKTGKPVTIALKKLDMKWVKKGENMLIIGPRNTGKSMLIWDYLKKHETFSHEIVVDPCELFDKGYESQGIKPESIYSVVTPSLMKNTVDFCRSNKQSDPKFSFAMIIDNIPLHPLCKDKDFRNLVINGRHLGASLLMTQQYPDRFRENLGKNPFEPSIKANLDWVCLGHDANLKTLNKLWKEYAGMFPTFEMFKAVHKQCTRDFGFLVIHQASRTDKIEDSVFWYRADSQ